MARPKVVLPNKTTRKPLGVNSKELTVSEEIAKCDRIMDTTDKLNVYERAQRRKLELLNKTK